MPEPENESQKPKPPVHKSTADELLSRLSELPSQEHTVALDVRDANSVVGRRPGQLMGDRVEQLPPGRCLIDIRTKSRFALNEPGVSIGRSTDNALSLREDKYVSIHHASISYEANCWWIADLGSRNGTLVNGVRISQKHRISRGDMITLGVTIFRVD